MPRHLHTIFAWNPCHNSNHYLTFLTSVFGSDTISGNEFFLCSFTDVFATSVSGRFGGTAGFSATSFWGWCTTASVVIPPCVRLHDLDLRDFGELWRRVRVSGLLCRLAGECCRLVSLCRLFFTLNCGELLIVLEVWLHLEHGRQRSCKTTNMVGSYSGGVVFNRY